MLSPDECESPSANDNNVEEPPPPSYDSVIKYQQEQLQGNQPRGELVQPNSIETGQHHNELVNQTLTESSDVESTSQSQTNPGDEQNCLDSHYIPL